MHCGFLVLQLPNLFYQFRLCKALLLLHILFSIHATEKILVSFLFQADQFAQTEVFLELNVIASRMPDLFQPDLITFLPFAEVNSSNKLISKPP